PPARSPPRRHRRREDRGGLRCRQHRRGLRRRGLRRRVPQGRGRRHRGRTRRALRCGRRPGRGGPTRPVGRRRPCIAARPVPRGGAGRGPHRCAGGRAMSTPAPVTADDAVVEKTLDDTRPASWWRLPAATTVMALIALLVFGLRGIPGVDSAYVVVHQDDLNPFGLIPAQIVLPSVGGAIALSVLALLASAGLWVLHARVARPPARLRIPLIAVFAVAWVLAFLTWVISQRTLDVTTLLQGTIVLAVPLAFGALSGVLSERSGVINIAIEGQLLFGAFGATLVGSLTGSVWIGL